MSRAANELRQAPASKQGNSFTRWVAANVSLAVPQSMAPITFGLVCLSRGGPAGGALMVTTMTVAQVVGAVPLTAAGRATSVRTHIRGLAGFRTVAFASLLLAIQLGASLAVLVAAASLSGLAAGALYGVLRSVLGDLVAVDKMPRALGLAATANEVVFVTGPILASAIGGASVGAAVATMMVASAVPIILLPGGPSLMGPKLKLVRGDRSPLPLGAFVWSLAETSGTACVSSVEVGAVALALHHKLAPNAAFIFTVPLCVAAIIGGLWTTVRNESLRNETKCAMLLLTGAAAFTLAQEHGLEFAIASVVVAGFLLAPLETAFSLSLEAILPSARRAQGFALLRTSSAVGLVISSSVIAFVSLQAAFLVSAALTVASVFTIACTRVSQQPSAEPPRRARNRQPSGCQNRTP